MFRSMHLRANITDVPPSSSPSTSTPFVCFLLRWARALGVFSVDVLGLLFFFVVAGAVPRSSAALAPCTTVDLRGRFEAVRGVLVATLAVRAVLGVERVVVDLRGERRLFGDSPFTPRSRRICARAFPSAGTKILGIVRRERTRHI